MVLALLPQEPVPVLVLPQQEPVLSQPVRQLMASDRDQRLVPNEFQKPVRSLMNRKPQTRNSIVA